MVKLGKGMTDVSEKGNIANCVEPSDNNYVSMWFCVSCGWKLQCLCRHINCLYHYSLTWAHDYVATDQRFLPHFPLSDLMVCNFLISDWDVLLGYLIKSFSSAVCMWAVACRTGNFLTARGLLVLDFFLPAFCKTAPLFLTQPSHHLAGAGNAIQCPHSLAHVI